MEKNPISSFYIFWHQATLVRTALFFENQDRLRSKRLRPVGSLDRARMHGHSNHLGRSEYGSAQPYRVCAQRKSSIVRNINYEEPAGLQNSKRVDDDDF